MEYSFMSELPLLAGESTMHDNLHFRCNICGGEADFVVQLELLKENAKYDVLHSQQMPFYLCKQHEYIYKKMQDNIELKDYFAETIKENQ